jgi:adenosylcobinamide kinase / adenosylcobinamide-phosphate guanylyltransferase
MSKLVLITGGARSGKSTYAQGMAEAEAGPRLYIATAVAFDTELAARIERHRRSREDSAWTTVEEPIDLAGAIERAAEFPIVLVDCLTLWVNNLLWDASSSSDETGRGLSEDGVVTRCEELLAACRRHEGTVILVTNEVGLGIIPDNPTSRVYRDLLGRCNQTIAAQADTVLFMVSGLSLLLKGRAHLGPSRRNEA